MLHNWYTEDQWCKGASALDVNGNEVSWDSPNAVKWDLSTAIFISYKKSEYEDKIFKLKKMQKSLYNELWMDCREYHKTAGRAFSPLWVFNDHPKVTWEMIRRLIKFSDI